MKAEKKCMPKEKMMKDSSEKKEMKEGKKDLAKDKEFSKYKNMKK